ncbi:MAG: hypothetical protein AAGA42_02290 [Actinomycetota bacterium]
MSDAPVPAERRRDLINQLTVIGWLLLGGVFGLMLFQIDRARSVDASRFAGVWEQRIEVLSFLVLPPNMIVLVPPALVGVAAAYLAQSDPPPAIAPLLRITAGIATILIVIGAVSIITLLFDDNGAGDAGAVFLRIGGMFMAYGIAKGCRASDALRELR